MQPLLQETLWINMLKFKLVQLEQSIVKEE